MSLPSAIQTVPSTFSISPLPPMTTGSSSNVNSSDELPPSTPMTITPPTEEAATEEIFEDILSHEVESATDAVLAEVASDLGLELSAIQAKAKFDMVQERTRHRSIHE